MNWWTANWQYVVSLAAEHLVVSVPAVVISIVIAVPIGRLAFRRPRVGGIVLGAATMCYAIPALPLLIIIPALAGTSLRSRSTMIIALTVYGVALLVRTAADAFASVDPHVRSAAVAIGNSPREILWRVDLPLAIPVLLSGVRVVMVSTIGLATIGALVGVPSLGRLLTDGFQRGIAAEVVVGVVATVIVALVLDGLLLLIGRVATPWARSMRRVGVSQ